MSDIADRWIEKANEFNEVVEEAMEHDLYLEFKDCLYRPDAVRQALSLLEGDTPLSDNFPDGTPATPPFTINQVFVLAKAKYKRFDNNDRMEIVTRIRTKLGRYRPRQCEGVTKTGALCKAHALAYINSPYCYTHASKEDREYNKKMLEEESTLIDQEYDYIRRLSDSGIAVSGEE